MEKKIPNYLIAIAAIIVVGIVVAGVIIVINENQSKKAIEAAENQMQTILAQSDEIAAAVPDDKANNIGEFVYSKMTYKVIEATKDSCTLRVSAPSLYQVFHNIYDPNKYETATDIESHTAIVEKIQEEILLVLTSGEYEIVTSDVVVPLSGDGKIQMTRELVDAMYGGLLTLQEEITIQYIEGMHE